MSKTFKRNPFSKREPGRIRREERRAKQATRLAMLDIRVR